MIGKIQSLWARRRERREAEAIDLLKARYHGFRILLDDNEHALRGIANVERRLRDRDLGGLREDVPRLLETVYDLVDGLNRIAEDGYAGLYDLHEALDRAIHRSLEAVAPEGRAVPFCVGLDQMDPETARLVGSKAGTLSVLRRHGLPVPVGFAVTTRACRYFLAAANIEAEVRRCMGQVELGRAPEAACAEAVDAILHADVPDELAAALEHSWRELASDTTGEAPPVSLRSSALVEDKPGRSFAGQFHSVLHITTAEDLVAAFKEVVAGNFAAGPTTYRREAGLPLADFDMAALCQVMVPARGAGVCFTVDPAEADSERMLITAVRGLGTTAVGGEVPADIYRPARMGDEAADAVPRSIAEKPFADAPDENGGLRRVDVPEAERGRPALEDAELARLIRLARRIESLQGAPQDIEWAVDGEGAIHILQSRPVSLPAAARDRHAEAHGEVLYRGGSAAGPGRAVGRVRVARSVRELDAASRGSDELTILVLRQSLVEAARLLPRMDGVIVETGNPVDHLSCVARELGIPMLTGAGGALETLEALDADEWVVLDADRATVRRAPKDVWEPLAAEEGAAPRRRERRAPEPLPPALAELRERIVPLNLTDAYGPTFSPRECRSLHDVVRYVHEMALLVMFAVGDGVLEHAGSLPRRLEGQHLPFLILDLGGALAAEAKGRVVRLEDVRSAPLLALCRGMDTPGLRWRQPPPGGSLSGVLSRAMLDNAGARPVGNFNYALATRDYLNLNARVDFHFAMVDAVCGPVDSANSIYFRFKGGGTHREQRERRTQFLSELLKAEGFFTDRQGDMVTGVRRDMPEAACREHLVMLGRVLGFTRLLDAAMVDDDAVERLLDAFRKGDYALGGFDVGEEFDQA